MRSVYRRRELDEDLSLTIATGGNRQQKNPSGEDGFEQRVKGVEPIGNPPISAGKQQISEGGWRESGTSPPSPVNSDPELRAVVEAWPTLPDALKAGIVAMVRAAKP